MRHSLLFKMGFLAAVMLPVTIGLDAILVVRMQVPSFGLIASDHLYPVPPPNLANLKQYFLVMFVVDYFFYFLVVCVVFFVIEKIRRTH